MATCPILSAAFRFDNDSGIFTPELAERNKITTAQIIAGIKFFKFKSTFLQITYLLDVAYFGFGVKG